MGTTSNASSFFHDNLRGLKIFCSWICSLIEIHFKFQALSVIKKRLSNLDSLKEKIDLDYYTQLRCSQSTPDSC